MGIEVNSGNNSSSTSSDNLDSSSNSDLSIIEYINPECIDIFSENINFYAYSLEENSFNVGLNEIIHENLYYARYIIYFDLDSLLKNYNKDNKYILILKPIFSANYKTMENGKFETDRMFVREKVSANDFINNILNKNFDFNDKFIKKNKK